MKRINYLEWYGKLEIGMNINEVTKICGKPEKIDKLNLQTIFYYDYPGGGKIFFDKEEKLVEYFTPTSFSTDSLIQSRFKNEAYLKRIKSENDLKRKKQKEKLKKQKDENRKQQEEEKKRKEEEYRYKNEQRKTKVSSQKDQKYYGTILELKGQVTRSEIKSQYKKLMKEYHPDKVAKLGSKLKEVAEDESKKINEAYEFFKRLYNFS